MNISFSTKHERILDIWGSQIYDPVYEIPEILESLKKRKKYFWQVNQEGKLGIIIMRPINRNIYELMMSNDYDKDGFYIDRRDLVKSK